MKKIFCQKASIIFVLVLTIQVIVLICYGNMKKGYFVDELWSYGLSNSYYHPHVYSDGKLDDWVEGNYFKDYLEVLEDQRFTYDSVIYNQENDYHPPLFYIVLHTVCSFFPNSFSKWYAIIPNIFYFCISMILLYKLGKILFGDPFKALIPIVAYGLCPGSISNVVYIRMYELLTVWVVYTFYIHSKWIKSDCMSIKSLVKLAIISYLGFMSHYYYFIFAFFISVFYVVFLLIRKRFKETIQYSFSMGVSLIMVLVTYPTAYQKLFFDYRGNEAVGNLFKLDDCLQNLKGFYEIMSAGVLANYKSLLWVGIVGIILVWKNIILGRQSKSHQFYIVEMAFVSIIMYMLIVAKIAPYQVDRYIFCIYPLVSLVLSYALFSVFLKFEISPVWSQIIVMALFLFIAMKGMHENIIQYIYPEMSSNIELAKEHAGDECIYITRDYYKLVGSALELENMGKVRGLIPEEIGRLPEIVDMSASEMIIYVDESFNQDEILGAVCESGGFISYEYLLTSRCNAYVMRR